MKATAKLAMVTRNIIKHYELDEIALIEEKEAEGNLVLVSYRFSVEHNHFPVMVLIDTTGLDDRAIIPAAQKRVHEVLTAALEHAKSWEQPTG